MSAALKRAEASKSALARARAALDMAERAVLALARRAEELEAHATKLRRTVESFGEMPCSCFTWLLGQLDDRAALAPKPRAKTKRKPMFTPKQERIIRECELGDEMPPRAKQGER